MSVHAEPAVEIDGPPTPSAAAPEPAKASPAAARETFFRLGVLVPMTLAQLVWIFVLYRLVRLVLEA